MAQDLSWIVIRSPASVVAISSSSIDWPQIPFFRPSFFCIAHASAFARARRERVVRTERRRRRSASLPCLSLLSPRDAIRIPIPSGPRCLRASALGPAVPPSVRPSVRPSVAVYLSLSVARRAVATLLTDQSESGGPAARDRERLMQLPVVSPSSPPSLLLLLASLVVFVVIVHCERRLCKRRVRARSAAMPFTCTRANSPSERTIPAVAVSVLGSRRRRRRRGLASHSLTIWFCGSTSRAASPGHAARRALPVPHA